MTNIYKTNTGGFIFHTIINNIENADARDFFFKHETSKREMIMTKIYQLKEGIITNSIQQTIKNDVCCQVEQFITSLEKEPLPPQIEDILNKTLKKKEQKELLNGLEISKEQFAGIFLQGCQKGYKYSFYRYEKKNKKYDEKKLPQLIHLKDDNTVEHIGNTTLSDGQMKEIVNSKNTIIAQLLDNGTHWHCFCQNLNGIQGKESGIFGSKPHIHYISDSFGISKEQLIERIKNVDYPSTPVHIILTNNGLNN